MKHFRVLLALACALAAYGQRPNNGGGGGAGVGPANQSGSFTSATSVVITDNLNTLNKIAQCVTASGTPITITDFDTTLNTSTITFASSTGSCRVNGTGGVGQTGPAGANGADGTNGGAYSYSFSYTGTPITLTAATHGRSSTITTKYVDGSGALMFPASETINGSGDVTFAFGSNTTGTLMVSGGGVPAAASNRSSTEAAKAVTQSGTIAFTTDGIYAYLDNGSTLAPYGPMYKMVAPVSGDFTNFNASTMAVSTTYGGINLKGVADSTFTWRGIEKNVPTAPYTIDIILSFNASANSGNVSYVGCFWKDATKLETISLYADFEKPIRTIYQYWDTVTAFNSTPSNQKNYVVAPSLIFLRLVDDSTNHEVWISTDGAYWIRQAFGGRTAFLTATKVGCGLGTNTSAINQMTIRSWYEH